MRSTFGRQGANRRSAVSAWACFPASGCTTHEKRPRRSSAGSRPAAIRGFPYLPTETRPSTQREWARLVKIELKPLLGDVDLTDVREARSRVRQALDGIVARGGGETANRLLVVASRVTSWAVSRDLVEPVASGVFVGLDKPALTRARSRGANR